jgi:hemoglobin
MSNPPSGGPAHRDLLTQEIVARTGIDEPMIERLVGEFYDRARKDTLLGPVFADHVADWDNHIGRICAFWSSVVLMTGRYHGQPLRAHLPLKIDASHFARWLALFEEIARDLCPPEAVAHFMERARRIASSFQLGMAVQRGELPQRGPDHSATQGDQP